MNKESRPTPKEQPQSNYKGLSPEDLKTTRRNFLFAGGALAASTVPGYKTLENFGLIGKASDAEKPTVDPNLIELSNKYNISVEKFSSAVKSLRSQENGARKIIINNQGVEFIIIKQQGGYQLQKKKTRGDNRPINS